MCYIIFILFFIFVVHGVEKDSIRLAKPLKLLSKRQIRDLYYAMRVQRVKGIKANYERWLLCLYIKLVFKAAGEEL